MQTETFLLTPQKERLLYQIALAVIFLHLLAIASSNFWLFTQEKQQVKKERKLLVQTVALTPKEKKQIAAPAPSKQAAAAIEETIPQVETLPEEIHEEPLKPIEKLDPPKEVVKPRVQEPLPEIKKVQKKPAEKKPVKKTEVKKPVEKPKPKKQPPKKAEKKEKPPAPKKTEPKPKTVEKPKVDAAAEAAKVKRKELLENAQKSIAKIGQESGKLTASASSTLAMTSLPSKIDNLEVETFPEQAENSLSPQEMSYYEELASRLKVQLRFPEYGTVKIKLTLARDGTFIKVTIVNSESSANRKYVEKSVPGLKFPAFGNKFKDYEQYTFVIALSNE